MLIESWSGIAVRDQKVKPPDHNLVTCPQLGLVDSCLVDVGAVGRPAVLDQELALTEQETAVLP
jgi:hypothetical protein